MCYTGKCKHEGYMGDCIAIMENGKLPCPDFTGGYDDLRASYSIRLVNTVTDNLVSNFKGCDYCGEQSKLKWCVTIASNAPSELQWICTVCGHHGFMLGDKKNIFKKLETMSKSNDHELIKALRLISRIDRVLSNIK